MLNLIYVSDYSFIFVIVLWEAELRKNDILWTKEKKL